MEAITKNLCENCDDKYLVAVFNDSLLHDMIFNYVLWESGKLYNGNRIGYYEHPGGIKSSKVDYKKGKIHGKYIEYYNNYMDNDLSKFLVIDYKKDKKHGKRIMYAWDGEVSECTDYVEGKKHGKHIKYYADMGPFKNVDYVEGRKHGKHIEHYMDGKPFKNVDYIRGEKKGRYLKYRQDGEMCMDAEYY